jgi:2-C-methyl-D-erythritol 2,4-cyclodiphosphate synthase
MFRVGHGIDVHPFAEDRPLILGGVRIADSGGLEGHSDADAVLHAVVDALLGGVAAGDIGEHFPSTSERWRGADSRAFAEEALRIVSGRGGRVVNIDVTVIAQRPRLAPHRDAMRESVAGILGVGIDAVSIKATTTDHLGFVGRGEGICAMAVALIEMTGRKETGT